MLTAITVIFLYTQLYLHSVSGLNITYLPSIVEIYTDDILHTNVIFQGSQEELLDVLDSNWKTVAEPEYVLGAKFLNSSIWCDGEPQVCNGTLQIEGRFLGFGNVSLLVQNRINKTWSRIDPSLEVVVLRQDKLINKLFTAFVAIVVSINYINMGCAMDLGVVKEGLRRPIGPAVGFVCQFVIMPLVSYAVGLLLFDDPVLRLGLFTFGSSPGGGASNMWTVLLGGNLNLSITMTFVSNVAALATLPLWLFTLGKNILQGTNIVIPFQNIFISLVSLTVPLGIGILIQKRFPKLAAKAKKILAPVSITIIICLIVMAAVINSYMFFMLTWRMVIAATLNVWAGFAAGVLVSLAFKFSSEDVIAISVETGIQNVGIAFILLSYSLKPPVSDMASVVPIAGSLITPIPLFFLYCCQKIKNCCSKSSNFEVQNINMKDKADNKGVDNPAQDDVKY